jgi:xylose isomerase
MSFAPPPPAGASTGVIAPPSSYDAEDAVFFPKIGKIPYEGPSSINPLAFQYYNKDEVILGRKMSEWCRFSVVFWHTFRGKGADPFGFPTITRPWDDESDTLKNAYRRCRAAFEFMDKLGVEYYAFHDRDVAPEGSTLEESNKNFDSVADLLEQLQKKTGIKLLWATQNMFSAKRFMNGAATNPDFQTFAYAAAQTKKCLEVGKRLGAVNHVFWGGREGYQSTLNTDVRRELDHLAAFFKMVVAYKEKIGFDAQCLIEPKPREPTKHQYDYDAQTVIGFLHHYGLEKHFKLNIEPNHTTLAGHDYEHDMLVASKYGMLGSVDSNTGDTLLGWDTDQFPMDIKKCALTMKIVIEQGGLAPGGLNFDCKVRRESTDLQDLFIAHIGAMDAFARGLRIAAKIISDKRLSGMVANRYSSFDTAELGKKVESGTSTLEELEAYAMKSGEPKQLSGQQELYEMILNQYM